MKLLLDPIWAWPWVILAAVGALLTVITTYRQRIAHLPAGQRGLLLGLRLLAWAVLVFSFIRPTLEFTETDPHAAVVQIVTDASRSMGVHDGSAGTSRRDALLALLAEVQKELESLKVEVQHFDFAEELVAVEEHRRDSPGEQTAIGHILDALPRAAQGKRIALALLLSDGANRAITPRDVDPRAAANRLAEQQIRVDTVPFGASGLTESSLDLIVEDVEVSPTVFVKNSVVVRAKVRALGAKDREVTARLLIEDPEALPSGGPAKMKVATPPLKLKPTGSNELLTVEMPSFIVHEPGEFKLTFEVVPLEGEPITVNNSLTTYLTVMKGGINVAYFDREHRAEIKFIRRIDESPDIQLDLKPIRFGPLGVKPPIEEEWFVPGRYDVYIIGSVPARVFGAKILDRLAQAVEKGAGLMMTGGTLSFGPGGYAETALADVLPVKMLRTELQNGDVIDPALHHDGALQMLPTPLGLQHFVMRIDSPEKNLARWKDLPPLDGANKFSSLKDGALELARSAQGFPLLVAQPFGRGRTIAFAADSTFLWYLNGNMEEHQRFWQQVIFWLAHKDEQQDQSVWVKLDTRRARVGQPVGMTFGARDKDKRPIDDAEFKIEIVGPENRRFAITPQRSGTEHLAKFLETAKAGEYTVRVSATKAGQAIGLPAESRFIVFEQDLELYNPAADPVLLEEISHITGGVSVPPEELAHHLARLARQGLSLEVTQTRRLSLWDNSPLLLLFVLTLTLEWFLRKRSGLV